MAGSDVDLLIHDLRGVLTTIKSWAALTELQTERGLLATDAVQGLIQSCAAADAIIDGYVGRADLKQTNLVEFLSQLERAVSQEFRLRGVLLQLSPLPSPAWAAATRGDLTIIIVNLLRNALEACQRGGRVKVSVRCSSADPPIEIVVEDSGEGLDEASFEAIFTPGVSRRGAGRGLGLHAARLAAGRSNGSLRAEHSELGGAAFVLSLPAATPVDAAQEVKTFSHHDRSVRGRILIVEDDPATRRFMQAALEHDGHEVLQAGSLKQARALLARAEVVIVDDRLPDGSGPELRHETSVPVMIVSGNPALSEEAGLAILRKPFDVQRLCAVVREHLTRQ